jgi:hypothetical protein
MSAIPAHELCSLTAEDLNVTGHMNGIALRFGPGPEIGVFPPSQHSTRLAMMWALEGLALLNTTLARKAV